MMHKIFDPEHVNDYADFLWKVKGKISIARSIIVELEAYGGFEKDVDSFFENGFRKLKPWF